MYECIICLQLHPFVVNICKKYVIVKTVFYVSYMER